MPQAYIDKWIRVVFHVAHEGNDLLMPFNLQYTGAGSSPNLDALLADMETVFKPLIIALLTTQYTVTSVEATDRSGPGLGYASRTFTSANVGTRSGDALPANVAVVFRWTTGHAGRSWRGRSYWFGLNDGDASQSIVTSGWLATATSLAVQLLTYTGPAATPVDFVVASIKDLALRNVTSYLVDNLVDSQRRRLPGRGT